MKPVAFSRETRSNDLSAMAAEPVDLLVIGGGITGAGVVRDAALRGLRVALVERRDFASGTSSRSSKLIHGGVRYLRQGDVALVVEAAEERRVLRRTAPHLAQPGPMLIPTFSRREKVKMDVGLWTFEKLGKIPRTERHEVLERDQILDREPLLRREELNGGIVYPENVTDDARLVLATIRSAKRAGALVANYAPVVGLERNGSGFRVSIRDHESGETLVVRAHAVVNAAGPWSDGVRALAGSLGHKTLFLTKGIHFVVRREDLPIRNMVIMQAPDRRPVFAIPRGDVVYVGTTDTPCDGSDDYPVIGLADVRYLIAAVHKTFEEVRWGVEKVVAAWAGLRPLIREEGKKPHEISRKDEILVGSEGLITVAGGKLTTYRSMAEKVVARVLVALERRADAPSLTADEPLEGGDLQVLPSSYARDLEKRFGGAFPGLERVADRLVFHHGSEAGPLLESARDARSGFLAGSGFLASEVDHAVDREMALHVIDVLERRFRLLLFDPGRGLDVVEEVADRMKKRLGWSRKRRTAEIEEYRRIAEACRPVEEVAA